MASRKRTHGSSHGNAALTLDHLDDQDDPSSADLSQCRHGFRDDQDCIECRTEGCGGGADCSCGSGHSRKRPVDHFRY